MSKRPITTVKTVVESIDDDGHGIKVFTLVDPDRWELPPFKPGAHVDLHLANGLVRTYSLCNDPADNTRYVVAVKREADGRGGSIALHEEVMIGDSIGVSLPRGGVVLDSPAARYILVAGGIGVTPYLSVASSLRRIGHDDFTLHVIAREKLPLKHRLAPLIAEGRVVWHDTSRHGRPEIAALLGQVCPDKRPDTVIACCGPESMISDFEQAAEGWPAHNVHVERFVPPPLAVDPDAKPYMLVLARAGTEIPVRAGQSMLSALEDVGIEVPTSCCGGICGACKVGWLEGRPLHRDRVLSPYERERFLMVCVAGSESERLVLDL
ncbi:PDR/VanB family oxidoreductase [Bradyrhizobium sp. STM 3562]|uniref:PDR/VanB family oxidoreductase n=1 Tax=Bradyrhizobium sp. STM 3562 TaxID=578924 RepID=UPI00388EC4E6